MRSDREAALRDFVTLVRGTTYKGTLVGVPGPALLGLGSIEPGGGFRETDFKTYGGECPEKLMLSPGDLFAALKGATKDGKMIGSVARVPSSVASGRLTQDTVKLQFLHRDNAEEKYLYWLLRTPQYREYCAGRATGSAVVALSREDFLSYPVPQRTSQRSHVVELLETIEERATLLRKTSATLEAIARALFKSWFVDFDPECATMEGRASPGMSEEAVSLFPHSLQQTDDGLLPDGWNICPLDEIARFRNGLALQKYPPRGTDDLPVIKIAQLRKGDTVGGDLANHDIPSEYVIQNGDVLFSWSGSLEVAIWCGGEGALNQHLFKVTSSSYPKWFYYLWTLHHLTSFRQIAASKATTMGHIQRHHLSAAKVVVPPAPVLSAVGAVIEPLIDQIVENSLQARTLADLRDTLLPRLISGKLRLPEDSTEPSPP